MKKSHMKTFQSPIKDVTLLTHNMFTTLFPVLLFEMNRLHIEEEFSVSA